MDKIPSMPIDFGYGEWLLIRSKAPRRKSRSVSDRQFTENSFRRTVHLHDVADELTLNGRVTFNQEQVAHVYPMFGGTVTELRAEVGDYVRKGDILAILRSGEVADYERQMKEAEQQVIIARRNVNATRDMFDSGLASDKDVLQARQELINAEAEEDRIKEIFSINNFSGRSFYEVKSPVSGFIVEKRVSRNMQLRPDQGEEIFTVSGLEHVWVMADVYESRHQ